MKKPLRSQYGYSKKTGWQSQQFRDFYDADLLEWYNRPITTMRVNPIHPSWEPFVKYFDPSDKEKSQGAFCRWCEKQGEPIRRSELSTAKGKEITPRFVIWISKWIRKDEKEVQGE